MTVDDRLDAAAAALTAGVAVEGPALAAALTSTRDRYLRRQRRRRRWVGAAAAVAVLLAGLGVAGALGRGAPERVVHTGPRDGASGGRTDRPVIPSELQGEASIWLSSAVVPPSGADLALLVYGDGGLEVDLGPVLAVDRRTEQGWEQVATAHLGDGAELGYVDEDPGEPGWPTGSSVVGPLKWLRVDGLATGAYRFRTGSLHATSSVGLFEVSPDAPSLPPAPGEEQVALPIPVRNPSGIVNPIEVQRGESDRGPTIPAGSAVVERWERGGWVGTDPAIEVEAPEEGVVRFVIGPRPAGTYRILFGEEDPIEARFWAEADPAAAAEPRPAPTGREPALWLSATAVPVSGAEVAVQLINPTAEPVAHGLVLDLERRDDGRWTRVGYAHLGSAALGGVGAIDQSPASRSKAVDGSGPPHWLRLEGLAEGTYRLRTVSGEGLPLEVEFTVVGGAPGAPPAPPLPDRHLEIFPALQLPTRSATGAAVEVAGAGGRPVTATAAWVERWSSGRWSRLHEQALTRAADGPGWEAQDLSRGVAGAYRLVVVDEDGAQLEGRFWHLT